VRSGAPPSTVPAPIVPTSIVEATDLRKSFAVRRDVLGRVVARRTAVDGVSFSVGAGETLAVVG
jgi:ABC-type oligopeptide transport system ATPase subunit